MGQEKLNTSGEHEDTQFIMTWGLLQDAVGREAVCTVIVIVVAVPATVMVESVFKHDLSELSQ